MFKYQSAYKQNASGFHGRTFWFTVLTFILIYAAMLIVSVALMLPLAFGDSPWIAMWILPMILIILLLSIFVIYPVSIGVLRFFASAYRRKDYSYKEVFVAFRKGNYSKIIKLSLIILLIYFAFSVAYGFLIQFLFMAINMPLIALGESMFGGAEGVSGIGIGAVIGLVLLNLLLVFISYIPYILIGIYMFLAFMVYIDQPLIATTDKMKIAWDVMFKAGGGLVRLIISNFLLLLIPSILYVVLIGAIIGISFMVGASQTPGIIMILLVAVSALLTIAAFCYVMYYMAGSVVAYYFKCRDELDVRYNGQQTEARPEQSFRDTQEDAGFDENDGLRPL
ncbi:hypothetical protein [Salinicoccus sp. HZC-1]|uniref:hypothetical protein n=1 Tax=Salinicoccus sp. HZC-1 TaxID=3385497 RepID=UPI00398A5358